MIWKPEEVSQFFQHLKEAPQHGFTEQMAQQVAILLGDKSAKSVREFYDSLTHHINTALVQCNAKMKPGYSIMLDAMSICWNLGLRSAGSDIPSFNRELMREYSEVNLLIDDQGLFDASQSSSSSPSSSFSTSSESRKQQPGSSPPKQAYQSLDHLQIRLVSTSPHLSPGQQASLPSYRSPVGLMGDHLAASHTLIPDSPLDGSHDNLSASSPALMVGGSSPSTPTGGSAMPGNKRPLSLMKVTIALFPRTDSASHHVTRANKNPKLQLTLSAHKSIGFIAQHLSKKWGSPAGLPVLKIFPFMTLGSEQGWDEASQQSLEELFPEIYQQPTFKLTYSWTSNTPSFLLPQPLPTPGGLVPLGSYLASPSQPSPSQWFKRQRIASPLPKTTFGQVHSAVADDFSGFRDDSMDALPLPFHLSPAVRSETSQFDSFGGYFDGSNSGYAHLKSSADLFGVLG